MTRLMVCHSLEDTGKLSVSVRDFNLLYHRRTRTAYVYNGCLTWYNNKCKKVPFYTNV